MKYICTEDIENLAAQGKKELVVDGNTVVMELARDMARQLGIVIRLEGSQPAPARPAAPASPSSLAKPAAPVASSSPRLDAKPKGCQHGPLPAAARPEQPKPRQSADGVVDQLVELVKQSAGKRSGN